MRKRKAGWTLLELMVAGSALLLLLGLSSLALASYGRTLRGLEREGDQMIRASHSMESMQSLILQSRPLSPGVCALREHPLELELLTGEKKTLSQAEATLTVRRLDGRTQVDILWTMPGPLPPLHSQFEATVRP